MNPFLKLVRPLPTDVKAPRVAVALSINGVGAHGVLRVEFTVMEAKLNARKTFHMNESAWGLWDCDVCELFLSSSQEESSVAAAPYFEFQVSPFGQYFELKILEPRTVVDKEFRSGVRVGAKVRTTQAWSAWMEIPLGPLGIDGTKPLFGNATACLLREPHRAYFSSNHAEAAKPDFHRPADFLRLI